MLRLSEEQMAILNFYSGTKEEITAELRKAVPFIEDVELKMLSAELLLQIESISNDEFTSIGSKGMLDAYVESRKETIIE